MIPASTIWNTGVKYENSIFHRQKFVYRVQRGCRIIPVPCEPCTIHASLFPYNCVDETFECSIYPWNSSSPTTTATSFKDILYQTVYNYMVNNSIPVSCLNNNSNTLITDWYLVLSVGGTVLINEKVYTGFGLLQAPTNSDWLNYLNTYLPNVINYGYNYFFDEDMLYFYNAGCEATNQNKQFQLNIGLDFSINCN
jgi:hypothetical protein